MPIFGVDQFAGMLPHFIFLCIPRLSGRPSSLRTSSQNSLWDSVVEHPYYIPNPLQSFNKHVCYKVSVCTQSLQVFIVPYFLDAINIYWCKNYPEDFSVICAALSPIVHVSLPHRIAGQCTVNINPVCTPDIFIVSII